MVYDIYKHRFTVYYVPLCVYEREREKGGQIKRENEGERENDRKSQQ